MKGLVGQVAQRLILDTQKVVICWTYRNGSWYRREGEREMEEERIILFLFQKRGD